MTGRANAIVTTAAMLLLLACGSSPDTAPTESAQPRPSPTATTTPTAGEPAVTSQSPSASPTASPSAVAWTSCDHPAGITVEYPAEWHVNSGETLQPCSAFDPQPLDVPDAQEFFAAAALLSVEQIDIAAMAAPDAQPGEVLDRRETMIDGQDAIRIETRSDGDALLPDGTRTTRWLVVLGRDQTLSLATHEVGENEYEMNREVLDEMASRLQLPAS